MPSPSANGESARARRVFLSFMARLAGGEREDFEGLCARHPELAAQLQALRALVSDGRGLPRQARGASSARMRRLLRVLRQRSRGQVGRYVVEGEIDRGAMGLVRLVRDSDLRRRIAMKVLKPRAAREPEDQEALLARFLDEAQVTAQLEHPGIVPVYDLGLDEEGQPFFTMQRVRGEDLRRVFARVRAGEAGWTTTRALVIVQRVCEAMAYAHAKGVVHRDLKPANVMVGRFGEVYVMDWGLAHVAGRPGAPVQAPLPVRPAVDLQSAVRTERTEAHDLDPDSPLYTMDGDVVGTPAYMAPEQARGELDRLGPWTDVYAVGAILYQLLAGRMPYMHPDAAALTPHVVWHAVLAGPPEPLETLAPKAPPEVVSICAKAMAREIEDRYGDMQALADDLRAYLEDRVVQAHRTGALVEFRKWVRRNRPTSAALAALLCVLIGSGFALAWVQGQRRAESARRVQELRAETLVAAVDELWPIHPDRAPAMEAWLDEARQLAEGLAVARAALERFEREHPDAPRESKPQAEGPDPFLLAALRVKRDAFGQYLRLLTTGEAGTLTQRQADNELAFAEHNRRVLELELPYVERELERLERAVAGAWTWRFVDPGLRKPHERLRLLVRRMGSLQEPHGGLIAEIELRLGLSRSLAERTLGTHAGAWSRAVASVSDRGECPLYDGLRLQPVLGLVPLRRDPGSGLWEFWHVLSGERPELGDDDRWDVRPETGIVLVLVPGGALAMGAQDQDPAGPNHPTQEEGIRSDLRGGERWLEPQVQLDAYFLSKYELTQAQWIRLTGEQPSELWAGKSWAGHPRLSRVHPVETVSWERADAALARWSLVLPTEAQWERATRAGTQLKYQGGRTFDSLAGAVNYGDLSAQRAGLEFAVDASILTDDGYVHHAPVDAFEPNAWGFHCVTGNVWEWCRDWYADTCERGRFRAGDGEHVPVFGDTKAMRGAGHRSAPSELRVSRRYGLMSIEVRNDLGVRPALQLAPTRTEEDSR